MSVGITEGYDPSWCFDWAHSTYDINILITKRLTDEVISNILRMRSNTILHLTCTGLHRLEPDAYTIMQQCDQVNKLISSGFSAKQVVLRIDPIIPTTKGTDTAIAVLQYFITNSHWYQEETAFGENLDNRVRFSFLDMYPHVIKRFEAAGIPLPYTSKHPSKEMAEQAYQQLLIMAKRYNLTLEGCAETGLIPDNELIPIKHRCPCGCLYCYWKD